MRIIVRQCGLQPCRIFKIRNIDPGLICHGKRPVFHTRNLERIDIDHAHDVHPPRKFPPHAGFHISFFPDRAVRVFREQPVTPEPEYGGKVKRLEALAVPFHIGHFFHRPAAFHTCNAKLIAIHAVEHLVLGQKKPSFI